MKKTIKLDWFPCICAVIAIILGMYAVVWITLNHPYIVAGMAIAGLLFARHADNLAKPIPIPKRTSLKKIPEPTAVAA